MSAIKAENITKKYGELSVLKGVSVEIKEREFVAITGASGAGKTTLLHILSTLDFADSGDLQLLGNETKYLSEKNLAKFRNEYIGFVFQFHNLLPEFTALENICIPAFIKGLDKKEAEERALFWLKKFGLSERKNHKPSELSGGEQQRIAVARALINSPKILFADEPSGNLDEKNAHFLHNLLSEIRAEQDLSVVVVTHNRELAKSADRVIELANGMVCV
jgi:lipoprotein-releasing system ATP-binding protein